MTQGKTETNAAATAVRRVGGTVSRTHEPAAVDPRAAADNPVIAC